MSSSQYRFMTLVLTYVKSSEYDRTTNLITNIGGHDFTYGIKVGKGS